MDGNPVATIALEATGEWTSYCADLNLKDGITALYFKYCGDGTFDFDSFTVT